MGVQVCFHFLHTFFDGFPSIPGHTQFYFDVEMKGVYLLKERFEPNHLQRIIVTCALIVANTD